LGIAKVDIWRSSQNAEASTMSVYSVLKICRQLGKDEAFKDRLKQDLSATLDEFVLTDQERAALLSGDVRTLHDLGAHGYLLNRLARAGIADLTPENYARRMKGQPQGSKASASG
jgi:hypothetical protein